MILTQLYQFCKERENEFNLISEERKNTLQILSEYIQNKKSSRTKIDLIFICTHNSRRSHFAQVWAQLAAHYYSIDAVTTYSGGTEATAFHPNALFALKKAGFKIQSQGPEHNPIYSLDFSDSENPMKCFSKVFDHSENPQKNFAAIMTCNDAEENCPFIPGAEARIGITYLDPKKSDGTVEQENTYDERSQQIAREMLFVFSKLK